MLVAVLCVAALAAPALGSPSGDARDVADKDAWPVRDGGAPGAPYTVQVYRSFSNLGPGALVTDHHVVCAAALLGDNARPDRLTVKAGTDLSFPFNPLGQTLAVSGVQISGGVAVLTLAAAVTAPSARPVVVAPAALAGSRATAAAWRPWTVRLAVEDAWLVLPKYCEAEGLCATGAYPAGALLAVDGALVGLAARQGPSKGPRQPPVAAFTDLTDASVQQFIAAATGLPGPTEEPTTDAPRPTTDAPRPTTDAPRPTTDAPRPTPVPPSPSTVPPSPTKPTESPTEPSPEPSTRGTPKPKPTPSPSTEQPPSGKTCSIVVKSLPKNAPILVQGDVLAFSEPNGDGLLVLAAGESIRLACPGSSNAFSSIKGASTAKATCVEDTYFIVNGKSADLSALSCKKLPEDTARRNGTCGDRGQFTHIQIGFALGGDDFVTQIDNCFDGETYNAVYSRMRLTPGIAGYQSGVKRPTFTPDDFYGGISPNGLYVRPSQQAAIGQLLGDKSLGTKYIPAKGNFFLARGHLSAKADYVLGSQQTATFHYVNAAPQWQTFNGVNWEKLESSVRGWVVNSGRSVEVLTGIWGTATLPNVNGVETELFLQADKKYLRVPKYYYKVVYDPATQEGTAFVGLNNPYHTMTDEDVLCKDHCAQYSWLAWNLSSQEDGNGFCCDINELRKTITTIPADLVVKGIL